MNLEDFRNYMIRDGLQSNTANSYVSYLKRLIDILKKIPIYANLSDTDKVLKFSSEDASFKREFDSYHNFNDDTFNDTRSATRKYKNF